MKGHGVSRIGTSGEVPREGAHWRQNGISNARVTSRKLDVATAALSNRRCKIREAAGGAAHYLLAFCGTTDCIPQRLHRQAQPLRTPSMVITIAGLANRRSWSMLRAASNASDSSSGWPQSRRQPVSAGMGPHRPQQTPADRHQAGGHDSPPLHAQEPRWHGPRSELQLRGTPQKCEDGPIAAVAVWQQVLAEQARHSVRRTQRGRGNEAHGTNSGIDRRAS